MDRARLALDGCFEDRAEECRLLAEEFYHNAEAQIFLLHAAEGYTTRAKNIVAQVEHDEGMDRANARINTTMERLK